jgi:hypothetical protein
MAVCPEWVQILFGCCDRAGLPSRCPPRILRGNKRDLQLSQSRVWGLILGVQLPRQENQCLVAVGDPNLENSVLSW